MVQHAAAEELRGLVVLAQEIAAQPHPSAASERAVELAATAIGCEHSGLARLDGDRLLFTAGAELAVLDALHAADSESGESIGLRACRLGTAVLSNDLEHDRRWRLASPPDGQPPVRAVLALPLMLHGEKLGVLTCYSHDAHFFDERRIAAAGAYADHVAIALSVVLGRQKVRDLHVALESNREIGVAVGIVMSRLRLAAPPAFEVLQAASQNSNRKLRDIARQVTRTGEVPLVVRGRHRRDAG